MWSMFISNVPKHRYVNLQDLPVTFPSFYGHAQGMDEQILSITSIYLAFDKVGQPPMYTPYREGRLGEKVYCSRSLW